LGGGPNNNYFSTRRKTQNLASNKPQPQPKIGGQTTTTTTRTRTRGRKAKQKQAACTSAPPFATARTRRTSTNCLGGRGGEHKELRRTKTNNTKRRSLPVTAGSPRTTRTKTRPT
jgi:transglutaminase/protease-like cytokinesis protein 3